MKVKFIKGNLVFYKNKLAKKGDTCVQLNHGATWAYSTKDPGSGRENVLLKKIKIF